MNFKRKKLILCYLFIYFIFIVNVLFNVKSLYLWNDESFTFHIIHHSFLNIINLTSQDVHPFLYYFIAKVMILPFKLKIMQIIILRLVSAIPYLILLIIGNTSVKHHFSNTTSLLYMFSIVTMPLLVQNIYQIRMYSWALLFTTIVFILLIYIQKGIKSNSLRMFLLVSLFSLLSAYTHYYALISVTVLYVLFFILFIIQRKKFDILL